MISIENFYWILWNTLLKPVDLDCWYYYPWGTKNNLSTHEFDKFNYDYQHNHVFFHFDQEPLWSDNLGLYDMTGRSWTSKRVKILANSELSAIKNKVCQSRDFLDWYFFYHGFAALDWFRDARYIYTNHPVQNAFLSMNHVLHRRSYRVSLLARLIDKNLTHRGSISFHTDSQSVEAMLRDPNIPMSHQSRALIQKHLSSLSSLPWVIDKVPVDGNLSARFGHREYQLWQNSLWHLVNETVFYESKQHLTEKIFKPIVALRPFMLVSAPGCLEYLRSYGFKTFDRWIDESYDQLHDPDQRLDAIINELAQFACMDRNQLRAIYRDMLPVLEFNKQHFFGKFREIIVTELVDNFDKCIRIWNNGRVDGRQLALHPDLESAKQILMQ